MHAEQRRKPANDWADTDRLRCLTQSSQALGYNSTALTPESANRPIRTGEMNKFDTLMLLSQFCHIWPGSDFSATSFVDVSSNRSATKNHVYPAVRASGFVDRCAEM
ncbi:MAG: hypothetical protein ACI92S_004840 [Planctomycetaceae bacterium]|jgi:hypothetical protein